MQTRPGLRGDESFSSLHVDSVRRMRRRIVTATTNALLFRHFVLCAGPNATADLHEYERELERRCS